MHAGSVNSVILISRLCKVIECRVRLHVIAYARFLWTAIYGLSPVINFGYRIDLTVALEDRWDNRHIKLLAAEVKYSL